MIEPSGLLERLVAGALAGRRDDVLFGAFCEDLVAAGLPLVRGAMGAEFLHPAYEVRQLRWVRGTGAYDHTSAREPDGAPESDDWLCSPPYFLARRNLRTLRRPIDPASIAEFPILADVRAIGGTEYLAFRQPVGPNAVFGDGEEVFTSWVTDRPGGFDDAEFALLERLQPQLVLAVAAVANVSIGRVLLETYLGRDAARRVLAGNIVRGRTDTIRAVIWYSDLQGFTRLSDMLPRAEILTLLNEYVEPIVEAIVGEGGEVLKFMGDGILAIFGDRPPAEACAAALRAWAHAGAATAIVSERRQGLGTATTRPYIALHQGEVFYGNFGGPTRLDFTVLGPAVNEAARIAALCRSLDQTLVVSDAFAVGCVEGRDRLVGLGRFALRGVGRPQMLWTLDAGVPS